MNDILIPIINKALPTLLANGILAVQPMQGTDISEGSSFSVRYYSEPSIPEQDDRIHDFVCGYLRYYGTEWISESLWITLKIKGL